MQTAYISIEVDPAFPKYQAFLASIPAKFGNDGMRGRRAADLVRHAVTIRRMIYCHMAFQLGNTPSQINQFIAEGFTEILKSLIDYSFFQSRETDILNATEEAWAIFRKEEFEAGSQRMALDSFNPTTAPN